MSSSRLLILGVLRIRQLIHGYDIRRELELWRAEQWANVAYGLIVLIPLTLLALW